jgi:hypothetical protein
VKRVWLEGTAGRFKGSGEAPPSTYQISAFFQKKRGDGGRLGHH